MFKIAIFWWIFFLQGVHRDLPHLSWLVFVWRLLYSVLQQPHLLASWFYFLRTQFPLFYSKVRFVPICEVCFLNATERWILFFSSESYFLSLGVIDAISITSFYSAGFINSYYFIVVVFFFFYLSINCPGIIYPCVLLGVLNLSSY